MSEATASAYAQLLSVGLLWVSVHCAGMCGPILIGFDVAGAARGTPPLRGALGVLTYQAGRALTYALLGGVAGFVGRGVSSWLHQTGSVMALAFAATVYGGLLLRPLLARRRRLHPGPGRPRQSIRSAPGADPLTRALTRAVRGLAGGSALNHAALGLVLGLLPCMLTFWVLGLAATTSSPLHGALLMLLLVVLTTPVLLGVTLLPRLFVRRLSRLGALLPRILLAVSATWLLLVGLAGFGVVEHVHIPITLGDEELVIMLW